MKRMTMFAVILFCAAIFAGNALGQVTANQKIVIVDSGAFADKDGITKFLNAVNALDKEFATQYNALRTDKTRFDNLEKELQTIQTQVNSGSTVPINPTTAQAKQDEYNALKVSMTRKSEDLQKAVEKRQGEILGPVELDIRKAMKEFQAKNGYDYIFDAQRLPQGMLLAFNTKNDVTKDFITFYNSRPATTAARTAPATRP